MSILLVIIIIEIIIVENGASLNILKSAYQAEKLQK